MKYFLLTVLVIIGSAGVGLAIYFGLNNEEMKGQLSMLLGEKEVLLKDVGDLSEHNAGLNNELNINHQQIQDDKEVHKKAIALLKQERVQERERLSEDYREMLQTLKKEVDDQRVKITELNGVIKVKMQNKILFPSGQAKLATEGKELLKRLAGSLKRIKNKRLRVEGHTDNIPINNPQFRSNWELSCARALSVLHILLDNSGMGGERFEAVGMGEFQPLMANDSNKNRAQNRRIEILLIPLGK